MTMDRAEDIVTLVWRKQVEALAKYIKGQDPKCSQDEAWIRARAWVKEHGWE